MRIYIVFDTNVIVSAYYKPDSNPGFIYKLIKQGIVVPIVSKETLSEYFEVLSRPKLGFSSEVIEDLKLIVKTFAQNVEKFDSRIYLIDPKDVIFYETYISSNFTNVTYLVTGNLKHFPIEELIVSPKEMVNIIQNSLQI